VTPFFSFGGKYLSRCIETNNNINNNKTINYEHLRQSIATKPIRRNYSLIQKLAIVNRARIIGKKPLAKEIGVSV
jgi:hypothetical protein